MAFQRENSALRAWLLALVLGWLAGTGLALAQPAVVEVDGGTQAASGAAVVEPVAPEADAAAGPQPLQGELPAALQPITISPRWAPLKLDLHDFVLPTDTASLIQYLAAGYFPQEAQLTLHEAVALAVEHNHDLNSARLSAMAACKGIDINWAALKPQLSLQAQAYWQRDNAHNSGGAASDDQDALLSSLALSLTQRIYDWGLTHRQIDTARAQFAIKNSAVDIAEQQVVAAVSTGYYLFSSALGQVRIRRDELALARMLLEQARLRFKVGTAPRMDVVRAEARVEQAQGVLVAALADLGDAAADFYAVLGVEDQRYVPAVISAGLLDPGAEPPAVAEVAAAAGATRPELEMQAAMLAAAQVKTALAKSRPVLEAYTNGALRDPPPSSGSASVEYGLQLSWKLYNGGLDKQEREQVQLELQAVAESLVGLEAKVELDATKAWNRLYAARATIGSARKNLELSAEALRIAAIGYAAGVITFVDYQDALDANVAAALGYLQALVEVKLAQVNLERAQGFPAGYPGDTRALAVTGAAQDSANGTDPAPGAALQQEGSDEH